MTEIYTRTADFTIPTTRSQAALEALRTVDPTIPADSTLGQALEAIINEIDETADGIAVIGHHDNYSETLDKHLAALAPYVRDGSTIEWVTARGELYRYLVRDGLIISQSPDITWRDDDPQPAPLRAQ